MHNLLSVLSLPNKVSFGLLLLRIVAGLAFMHHGWGKIQNPMGWMGPEATVPGFIQALAAIAEFGGGFAWIIGLLTRLASFLISCTMSVAIYTHMIILHDPFVASKKGEGAFEPALVYLVIAILLFLAGPGKYSLDRVLFAEQIRRR